MCLISLTVACKYNLKCIIDLRYYELTIFETYAQTICNRCFYFANSYHM